jgi:hypothetical protein
MGTQSHPGKGLSLSQLAFALNEELKRTAYSSLYVTDDHFAFGGLLRVYDPGR